MIILSIDVGIKNLAVCCFDINLDTKEYKVINWNVHNLCENSVNYCTFINKKNNKKCDKKAKYVKDNIYCCKTHANISEYFIPTTEMNMKSLKKKRISELYLLAKDYNIDHDSKILKNDLLSLFENYIKNNYFNLIIPVKVDDTHIINIGRKISDIFNKNYNNISIDCLLIENQISPIANKMNTIQGMISQYFIMTSKCDILFVSSINKLKDFEDCKKLSYNERKKKSIEICRKELVSNNSSYLLYFDKNNKKDDLADSYLQGLWYIRNKLLI